MNRSQEIDMSSNNDDGLDTATIVALSKFELTYRNIVYFSPFRYDFDEGILWRGATEVPLRPKPRALLAHLLNNPDRLISCEEIKVAVWGNAAATDERLESTFDQLNDALKVESAAPPFIQSINGSGLRFSGVDDGLRDSTP